MSASGRHVHAGARNSAALSDESRVARPAKCATEPIAHFTFSESFTGSLKQALKQAKRADAVFCFIDDLSFGPIDPSDPAARLEWIDRELFIDFGDREAEIKRLDDFWATAAPSAHRIVWVSKHVARERADFLE